jgi:hypothetical protein
VRTTRGRAGMAWNASWRSGHDVEGKASVLGHYRRTHWKTPLERLAHCSLLAAVSDPSGDEGADAEEELEGSGESASVGRVRYRSAGSKLTA